MNAHELAHILLNEPEDSEVFLVDPGDQSISYEFSPCSQVLGMPEIPSKWVMLLPLLSQVVLEDEEG